MKKHLAFLMTIYIYTYIYIYTQIKFSYYSPTELKSKNGPNVSLNQYKYS